MDTSIVLMSYNQEAYVAEAVLAVLAQEGPPLEIILSDDCSQDATYRIMQELVAEYRGPHRVMLRRNERNLGLIGHFRTVFDLCSNDVVIVAGGDDIPMPDRAVRIREVFATTDAWLVYSHATCMDTKGNAIPRTYLNAAFHVGADLETISTATALYVGATGAYRRQIFQKYGHISNPRAYEDLVYGFRAALENRVQFIDHPLIRYRVGSGISTQLRGADPAVKRQALGKLLRMQLAVFAQRRRDARTFGLSSRHPIAQLIKEKRLAVLFQLAFSGEINPARCAALMLRHPILAFRSYRQLRKVSRKSRRSARARARRRARTSG